MTLALATGYRNLGGTPCTSTALSSPNWVYFTYASFNAHAILRQEQ